VNDFARACEAIAATASKTEKVARLGAYLRGLGDDDLAAAARFFTGNPLAASEQRSPSIGSATIVAAARTAWGFSDAELGDAYRATGDLGSALAPLVRAPLDLGLFREPLTPAALTSFLIDAAGAAGRAAAGRRRALTERILRAVTSGAEARFVVKVLTGQLRIGLREGLVLDAIANAFDRRPEAVRRAAMSAGDVGAVALAARRDALAAVGIRYGNPIGFMLASPIVFGSPYRELATGEWHAEDKFDGVRVQAHKRGSDVRLFTRTFADAGRSFPEIVAALAEQAGDVILDGEVVARDAGRALPFRYLQPRLQRKAVGEQLQRQIPVTFVAFDLLARGEELLIDEPYARRRALLEQSIVPSERVDVAASIPLATPRPAGAIDALFDASRLRGNEGLVFKRADAPYAPGRRGKAWLKLKRELSTIDAVVIGVEWGHGKRSDVLSDYTFAVRAGAGDDRLLAIGKAYSGLTDAEIATMTHWFLAHRSGALGKYALAVEPAIVVEIAFDIIQRSTLHESGFALRFPRIVRLRPDKPAAEADTLADVERIYREMLEREGVTY
jgi:DNA ligase-1